MNLFSLEIFDRPKMAALDERGDVSVYGEEDESLYQGRKPLGCSQCQELGQKAHLASDGCLKAKDQSGDKLSL